MTLLYSQYKCPSCHKKTVSKVGKMIRCTCGWWKILEESEELATKSVWYAKAIAS